VPNPSAKSAASKVRGPPAKHVIPAELIYEPNWETGKSVRWSLYIHTASWRRTSGDALVMRDNS
jgi:hypothetical protein